MLSLKEFTWAIGPAILIAVCVFAWLRGGAAERYGALLILATNIAGDVALAVMFPHFPGLILATLDFILAAGLLILAIRYASVWLGVAMMLQSISLCSHAFSFDGSGLGPNGRVALNNALTFLMLSSIVVATALSWRAAAHKAAEPQMAPAV